MPSLSFSESWDLSQLSAPAAAAVTGSRVMWSAKVKAQQTRDKISTKLSESLQSLASMEDEDEYYMNPDDPTRVSRVGFSIVLGVVVSLIVVDASPLYMI